MVVTTGKCFFYFKMLHIYLWLLFIFSTNRLIKSNPITTPRNNILQERTNNLFSNLLNFNKQFLKKPYDLQKVNVNDIDVLKNEIPEDIDDVGLKKNYLELLKQKMDKNFTKEVRYDSNSDENISKNINIKEKKRFSNSGDYMAREDKSRDISGKDKKFRRQIDQRMQSYSQILDDFIETTELNTKTQKYSEISYEYFEPDNQLLERKLSQTTETESDSNEPEYTHEKLKNESEIQVEDVEDYYQLKDEGLNVNFDENRKELLKDYPTDDDETIKDEVESQWSENTGNKGVKSVYDYYEEQVFIDSGEPKIESYDYFGEEGSSTPVVQEYIFTYQSEEDEKEYSTLSTLEEIPELVLDFVTNPVKSSSREEDYFEQSQENIHNRQLKSNLRLAKTSDETENYYNEFNENYHGVTIHVEVLQPEESKDYKYEISDRNWKDYSYEDSEISFSQINKRFANADEINETELDTAVTKDNSKDTDLFTEDLLNESTNNNLHYVAKKAFPQFTASIFVNSAEMESKMLQNKSIFHSGEEIPIKNVEDGLKEIETAEDDIVELPSLLYKRLLKTEKKENQLIKSYERKHNYSGELEKKDYKNLNSSSAKKQLDEVVRLIENWSRVNDKDTDETEKYLEEIAPVGTVKLYCANGQNLFHPIQADILQNDVKYIPQGPAKPETESTTNRSRLIQQEQIQNNLFGITNKTVVNLTQNTNENIQSINETSQTSEQIQPKNSSQSISFSGDAPEFKLMKTDDYNDWLMSSEFEFGPKKIIHHKWEEKLITQMNEAENFIKRKGQVSEKGDVEIPQSEPELGDSGNTLQTFSSHKIQNVIHTTQKLEVTTHSLENSTSKGNLSKNDAEEKLYQKVEGIMSMIKTEIFHTRENETGLEQIMMPQIKKDSDNMILSESKKREAIIISPNQIYNQNVDRLNPESKFSMGDDDDSYETMEDFEGVDASFETIEVVKEVSGSYETIEETEENKSEDEGEKEDDSYSDEEYKNNSKTNIEFEPKKHPKSIGEIIVGDDKKKPRRKARIILKTEVPNHHEKNSVKKKRVRRLKHPLVNKEEIKRMLDDDTVVKILGPKKLVMIETPEDLLKQSTKVQTKLKNIVDHLHSEKDKEDDSDQAKFHVNKMKNNRQDQNPKPSSHYQKTYHHF